MTEKYDTTQDDAQVSQRPNKRMVIDERGDFVMQSIISEESEMVQSEVFIEPEVMQPALYANESLAHDMSEVDEPAIRDGMQPSIDEPVGSDDRRKMDKKSGYDKKSAREKKPRSVMDKMYRGVGMVAIAGLGWTGIAGVSNYAASKGLYGVDIGFRQQLDNATKLPDEIDQRIEQAKQAIDFINIFNMKEVTGDSND